MQFIQNGNGNGNSNSNSNTSYYIVAGAVLALGSYYAYKTFLSPAQKQFETVRDEDGFTQEVKLEVDGKQRLFVVHVPPQVEENPSKPVPLVFYLHAKQGSAWHSALEETEWRKRSANDKDGFIVVYGQADGKVFDKPVRALAGKLAFSASAWDVPCPDQDLDYIKEVLGHVKAMYSVDSRRVYMIGYSNGGLFTSNVATAMPEYFTAICNFMGGYQMNTKGVLHPKYAKGSHLPVYIITGTEDAQRKYCEEAKNLMEGAGFPVKFEVMEGAKNSYIKDKEADIWNFFSAHTMKESQ